MNDNYIDSGYLDDNSRTNAKERDKSAINEALRTEADRIRAMARGSVRVRDFTVAKIVSALELTMLVLTARDHVLIERKPD